MSLLYTADYTDFVRQVVGKCGTFPLFSSYIYINHVDNKIRKEEVL